MKLYEEIIENIKSSQLLCESIGNFVNIELFSLEQLDAGQVGYRVDTQGNSLITGGEGSWEENWIVIGYETMCGDPIVINLDEEGYPVFSLMHGMGSWEGGTSLSDSISSFSAAIGSINQFIEDKGLSDNINTVRKTELKSLIDKILKENKYVDFVTWESLLSPLFDMAEEYEVNIKNRVRELNNQGLKIADISAQLGISLKEVYEYLMK